MISGNANNNKYYEMVENGDGTFTAKWGRVGYDPQYTTYPVRKWNTQYNSKVRKGYKDVTDLAMTEKIIRKYKDISDSDIADIVTALQNFANKSVDDNYTVNADSVTQKQIQEAQKILNKLQGIDNVKEFNEQLEYLFTVIPRKMASVKNHLLSDYDEDEVNRCISKEQDTLDVMKGQVDLVEKSDKIEDLEETSILDIAGITMEKTTLEEEDEIVKLLGDQKGRYRRSFKVLNNRTQKKFDTFLKKAPNKHTQLFWHGSRNENWWSILGGGLILRPTNAVITGKMFGYGLYFADKAKKSLGYTSLRGSYWARGSSNIGYMSLFKVHLGKPYHVRKHTWEMSRYTYDSIRNKGDYDSLYAEGGIDLFNNEYIVYKEDQCTVNFIVELS